MTVEIGPASILSSNLPRGGGNPYHLTRRNIDAPPAALIALNTKSKTHIRQTRGRITIRSRRIFMASQTSAALAKESDMGPHRLASISYEDPGWEECRLYQRSSPSASSNGRFLHPQISTWQQRTQASDGGQKRFVWQDEWANGCETAMGQGPRTATLRLARHAQQQRTVAPNACFDAASGEGTCLDGSCALHRPPSC